MFRFFVMKSTVQGVEKVLNQHLYFYHKTIYYTFRCFAVLYKKDFQYKHVAYNICVS